VYSVILPRAAQVLDPFHVISLANRALDAVRRRAQTEQTGHRGRREDPLYRARRALLIGEEKLDDKAAERLLALLELGDPNAEVAVAYRLKERLRDFYRGARRALSTKRHATRDPKARQDASPVVREDLQLPTCEDVERAHRGAQQLDQAHQVRRLRF
jgi:transposase